MKRFWKRKKQNIEAVEKKWVTVEENLEMSLYWISGSYKESFVELKQAEVNRELHRRKVMTANDILKDLGLPLFAHGRCFGVTNADGPIRLTYEDGKIRFDCRPMVP